MRICREKLNRHGVLRMRLVATEACRRALNGDHFIKQVRRETGLQLETLKDVVLRGEEGRQKTDASLARLAEGISEMTYAVQKSGSGSGIGGAGMAVLERIAQSQTEIARILRAREEEAGMLDGEARARLRNIDVQLLRILEEMSAGRQDSIAELRADLAQLSQAVMALANAGKQD